MADEWQCGACTFFNKRGLTKCAMCMTNKGSSSRKNKSTILRQEQEAEIARLSRKPKERAPRPKPPPTVPQPRPKVARTNSASHASSAASASSLIGDNLVKHSITEQGKTVIIYGAREAISNFGINIGTSHVDTGSKKGKKRSL